MLLAAPLDIITRLGTANSVKVWCRMGHVCFAKLVVLQSLSLLQELMCALSARLVHITYAIIMTILCSQHACPACLELFPLLRDLRVVSHALTDIIRLEGYLVSQLAKKALWLPIAMIMWDVKPVLLALLVCTLLPAAWLVSQELINLHICLGNLPFACRALMDPSVW